MRDAGRRAWFLEGRANWADGHQKRVIRAEHGARAVSPWKCCSLARTSMGRRCRRGHPRKYHRIKTPIIRRRIRILVLRRPNGRICFRVVGSDASYIMGSREISGLRSSLADRARAALPKRDIPIRRGTLGIPNRGSGGVHPAGPPRFNKEPHRRATAEAIGAKVIRTGDTAGSGAGPAPCGFRRRGESRGPYPHCVSTPRGLDA